MKTDINILAKFEKVLPSEHNLKSGVRPGCLEFVDEIASSLQAPVNQPQNRSPHADLYPPPKNQADKTISSLAAECVSLEWNSIGTEHTASTHTGATPDKTRNANILPKTKDLRLQAPGKAIGGEFLPLAV